MIIPTLNEGLALPSCLESIGAQESPHEIIVVDCGSEDTTKDIAQSSGATVLDSSPGRWRQMNFGAATASGDILLFLHADCILPPHAFQRIRHAISRGIDGGAFTLRFRPTNAFLSFTVFWANLFIRATRDFQGDRGIFARREVFEKLDGYRDMSLMEDLDFAVRMRRNGFRTRQLIGPVTASSRRFEGMGVLPVTVWTLRLLIEYHLGRDLDKTARQFYAARKR